MYLFFYDVVGVCLIFIFYEFYDYLYFSTLIEVYLTTLCLLIFLSLLRLKFLTHYILLTNFSKLLKLRFLTHYIPFTYFSKLLKLRFFIAIHFAYC